MTASDIVRIATTVGMVQLVCDLFFNYFIFYRVQYKQSIQTLFRTKLKWEQSKKQQQEQVQHEKRTLVVESKSKSTKLQQQSSSSGKKKLDKNVKKTQRIDDDYKESVSVVAKYHMVSNVITAIVFVILLRILGTELHGQIIAVLPFAPFPLFRRLTARGLSFVSASSSTSGIVNTAVTVKELHDILLVSQSSSDNDEMKTTKGIVSSAAQACSYMFIYMLSSITIKFYIHKLMAVHPPKEASDSLLSILDSPSSNHLMRSAGLDPGLLKNNE